MAYNLQSGDNVYILIQTYLWHFVLTLLCIGQQTVYAYVASLNVKPADIIGYADLLVRVQ